jgi:hypothetical protein
MSFAFRVRRLDPHSLFPANERNAAESSEAPQASSFSSDDESANDPTEEDLDEALAQVASQWGCDCPLCSRLRRAMDQ